MPTRMAGEAAGAAIDQNPSGAAAVRQFRDHRDQPLSVAASDFLMVLGDDGVSVDQRDRAGGGGGIDDERQHPGVSRCG